MRRPIDQATHRISAASLKMKGIKNVRVLNESRFLSVVEGLVEERVKARLAGSTVFPLPAASEAAADPASETQACGLTIEAVRDARAQYHAQWREFRERFEEKLRRLEERAALLGAGDGSPAP